MDKLVAIKKIAQDTRRWAMRNRHKVYVNNNLSGMCAIASGELHRRLTKAGFDSTIALRDIEDDGHAFVICEQMIIDVTATQFSFMYVEKDGKWQLVEHKRKPVEITPLVPKDQRPTFWQEDAQYKTVDHLIDSQHNSGWPPDQIAWKTDSKNRFNWGLTISSNRETMSSL